MRDKKHDSRAWSQPSQSEEHEQGTSSGLTVYSEEGLSALQRRIEELRHDIGARGAMLLDQSGQLLTEAGRRGDFDTNTFLALLGNAMAAANQVAQMLQDEDSFDLHYHEGAQHEIFTARINGQILLCLLLDRTRTSSRVGMVWLSLRRTAADLRELLAQDMMVRPGGMSMEFREASGNADRSTNAEGNGGFESALDDELDRVLGVMESPSLPQAPVFQAPPAPEAPATFQTATFFEPPPALEEPTPALEEPTPAFEEPLPPSASVVPPPVPTSESRPSRRNVKRQFDAEIDQMLRTRTKASRARKSEEQTKPAAPPPAKAEDSAEDLPGDTILSYEQAVKLGLIKKDLSR